MKKICFISTIPSTLEAFVLAFAVYLKNTGEYDITLVCNSNTQFADSIPTGLKYHPIKMSRGISISGVISTIKLYIFFRKNKFDLVQFSTPNASLYASLAAWAAGIPNRVYCQWGILYVGYFGLKRRVFRWIEKIVCSCATAIRPDSNGNYIFSIRELLYKPEKGRVIHYGSASGVDLRKFDFSKKNLWRQEIRAQYGLDENNLVVGFVGRITRDKGVNELLLSIKSIISKSPNCYLMLVGGEDGKSNLDFPLYQWSKTSNGVIYCGPQSMIEKYYAAFDLFVLPSYREGFGSVVIEASAMGVPVVVTNIPGPTEAMQDYVTGIVVSSRDSEDLRRGIELLLNNPELRIQFGIAGHEFVLEKFEQTQLFSCLKEDRDSLMNGKRDE